MSVLAEALDIDLGSVKAVARALREAGWLPTGPRGVNAPQVTEADAAYLTLALLLGSPPSRVVRDLELYERMQPSKGSIRSQPFIDYLKNRAGEGNIDSPARCLAALFNWLGHSKEVELYFQEHEAERSVSVAVSNRPLVFVISLTESLGPIAHFSHSDQTIREWKGGISSTRRIQDEEVLRITSALFDAENTTQTEAPLHEESS